MAEESTSFLLENVRLSFEHLFAPHASVVGGKEKYRATVLMDPETPHGRKNVKKIENAIRISELAKFNKSPMTYKDDRVCFMDGDDCKSEKTGKPYVGYPGMKVLVMSSDTRPSVVDRDRSPLNKDDGKPFSGCFVNVYARVYSVKGADKGGNGTFCAVECVQYYKHGEPFGAAKADPNEVFKDLSEDDDDDDGDEPAPSRSSKPKSKPADDDDDDDGLGDLD